MKKGIIITAVVLAICALIVWLVVRSKDETGLGISSKEAVCIIDGVAIKDAPAPDGKFVATINFGEKLTIEDKKEVETSKGTKIYYKVSLKGGQEGWLKSANIIVASRPAAIAEEAVVYKRPDLITKSEKVFSPLDIVAVKKLQGDFVEVYGTTKDGKKVKGGWVKLSSITFEDKDVAVALYVAKATKIKNNDARMAAIKEIVENPDFSGSRFMVELNELVADAPAPEEMVEESTADTTSDE